MTQPSPIDPLLLEILVCPQCHSALLSEPDTRAPTSLLCTGNDCGLRYPVRDGIPILLVDETTRGS